MFNPQRHHRRSIRLAGYDYRNAGAYFITICTAHKRPVFGRIENGAMRLHPFGRIADEEWQRVAALRAEVELDEWIVMPNHFHAILLITSSFAGKPQDGPCAARSLGAIVRGFKSAVTRHINVARAERDWPVVEVWQRGFYERIIRDETELNDTRRYILENPQNWATDENNPSAHP